MAHKAKRPVPAKANTTAFSAPPAASLPYTGISSHTDSDSIRNDASDSTQDTNLSLTLDPQSRAAWIEGVNQLPQNLREWGSKAVDQVNSLSTTQKVVGGALLLGGIGWLSLRAKDKAANAVEENAQCNDEAQRARPWGSTGYASVGEPVQPIGGYSQNDPASY